MNRRDFIVGAACAACAMAAGGCAAKNPIRTVAPRAPGEFELPPELGAPGGSVKTEFDGDTLIVWRRSDAEFGAASIVCTHRGSEVAYQHGEGVLACPSHGSRFALDGSVQKGPAKRPLIAYRVTVKDGVVRITSA